MRKPSESSIVSISEDAALGLLVPTEMHEVFFAGPLRGTGVASYSNYRGSRRRRGSCLSEARLRA